MLEREFQTKFLHWLRENPPKKSVAYEFKVTKGSTFNLKQWIKKSPHQARGLAMSKKKWLYHKISDQSIETKPFDAFALVASEALLVIWFDAQNAFCILDIDEVLQLIKNGENVKFSNVPPDRIKRF